MAGVQLAEPSWVAVCDLGQAGVRKVAILWSVAFLGMGNGYQGSQFFWFVAFLGNV